MRRPALHLVVLALCTGCGWSNSLYLARHYAGEARSNERKGRPFEAQVLWGQVLSKADSAWARSGETGYEARALRGIARARLGDCAAGVPDLESSLIKRAAGNWQDLAHYELGRCEQRLNLPGAELELRDLLNSHDPMLRVQAAIILSEVYLDQKDWAAIFALLPGVEHPILRFARAVADVGVGKLDESRLQISPLLATKDTLVTWQRLVEGLSVTKATWTDSLLGIIQTFPNVSQTKRAEWLLAGIQGALEVQDTAAASARLARLAPLGATVSFFQARRLVAEYQISRVSTLEELARVVATLPQPGPEDGGPNHRMLEILRTTTQMLSEKDSLTGLPQGDLRLYAQAQDATSVLGAPGLARASLQRLERDWPNSPYLVKVLLQRMLSEPDSAAAIRARLALHPTSAYSAYLRVEEDARYPVLEDSLGSFLTLRAITMFNRSVGGNGPFPQ